MNVPSRSYKVKVEARDFLVTAHLRNFSVIVPKGDFLGHVPKRTFQTIPDTTNRVVGGVEFTRWGQENIKLGDVLDTFGDLP